MSYRRVLSKSSLIKILVPTGWLTVVALIALILGFAAALGMHKVIVVILAGLVGVLLLKLPSMTLLAILFALSVFVVGQINYFAGFKQIVWLPYLFGLMLYLKAYFQYISDPLNRQKVTTPIVGLLLTLFLLVIFSTVINEISILQAILASRDILFLWSIFFIIVYSGISLSWFSKAWRLLPIVIAFQIPLVLYQAFVIVPQRVGITIWDAIVGGFGGDPMGGGASPALALFLVVAVVYFTARYRASLISKGRYIFYIGLTLPSFILAEIKVIFILLPVGLFLLFIDKLKTHTFRFILISLLFGVALVVLMGVYEYQKRGVLKDAMNPIHLYERTFEDQLDSEHIANDGEIGRLTVITHWWSENGFRKPVETLFGYGVGATDITPLYIGEIRFKYFPLQMDRSVVAILLWEQGLVGVLLFILILLRSAQLAARASKSKFFDANDTVVLQTTAIVLVLALVMMLHSTVVFYVPAVNLLIVVLIGYSVYCHRLLALNLRPKFNEK